MDLTVRDAAGLLHVSENAVYRWIHDGTLPSYRVNDKYRLNRVELLEWATARNMKLSPQIFGQEQGPGCPPQGLPPRLLSDAVRAGGVIYDLAGADKASVLAALCQSLVLPEQVDRQELHGVLLAREALGSTAIGRGIAIPHPRSPLILGVKTPSVTLAFLKQPVEFGALDGRPVSVLFTIISTTIRIHLQLLSRLMLALQDETLAQLLQERSAQDRLLTALGSIEAGFVARQAVGTAPAAAGRASVVAGGAKP